MMKLKYLIQNIKRNLLLLIFKTGIINQRCAIDETENVYIDFSKLESKSNSTNNIFFISCDSISGWFREIKVHSNPYKFVIDSINDYECNNLNKNQIIECLKKRKNFYKFFHMGEMNNKLSNLYIALQKKQLDCIGLVGIEYDSNLHSFLNYMWSEIYSYRLNSNLRDGEYQCLNYTHSFCECFLAKYFGLDLLVESKIIKLVDKRTGKIKIGTIQKNVDGVNPKHVSNKDFENIDIFKLFDSLSSLNYFDAICNEKDHRPGNYYYVQEANIIKGISAFDNDSPMAFFPTANVSFTSYMGSSKLVEHGLINRLYINSELEKRILNFKAEEISVLKEYLSGIQFYFLLRRIKKLRLIILRSKKKKQLINDLTLDIVNSELKNNTYYSIAIKWNRR